MFNKLFRIMAGTLLALALPLFTVQFVHAADSTVYSADDVKKTLYSEMVSRDTDFTIVYVGEDADVIMADPMSFFKTVFDGSDDYLKWNRERFYFSSEKSGDTLTMDFQISYLTTAEQEAFVSQETDRILAGIIAPGMSDYEKLKAVHDYICDHVSYDYSLKYYSAYDALARGKAVCQGYSLLMDRMLEKAGISTRIIDGRTETGAHAWNLVRLDGVWYHVDATNDDTNDDAFFLKTDAYMADRDFTWTRAAFPKASTVFKIPFKISVRVDGAEIAFDVPPYVNSDDRTMVPVRFISESLGADVRWNNADRAIIVENDSDLIIMTADTEKVMVNGEAYFMDTAAVVKNGRTMVPLRFISECLGAEVRWDDATHTVDIFSSGYGAN